MATTSDDDNPFILRRHTDKHRFYSRRVNPYEKDGVELYTVEDLTVFDDLVMTRTFTKQKKKFPSGKVKVYFRKESSTAYTFRRKDKYGKPMFRILTDHGDFTAHDTYRVGNSFDREVGKHVSEIAERILGIKIDEDWKESERFYQLIAYPMFRSWALPLIADGSSFADEMMGNLSYKTAPAFKKLSLGFRRYDAAAMVADSFGKRFVTDAFIEKVKHSENIVRLAALSTFRSQFTAELGMVFLSSPTAMALDEFVGDGMRENELSAFVAHLEPSAKASLLLSVKTVKSKHQITESLRIVSYLQRWDAYDVEGIDFRNWKTVISSLNDMQRVFIDRINEKVAA
jgi:hypothetical protein